jgi:deoxyribonuclease-4
MFIGGHVSIAGGFDKSIDRAVAIGGNCLQTFASSPRSLSTTPFPEEVLELYRTKKRDASMGAHFFHGVYLINLAHENSGYVEASIASLDFYQKLAGTIGGAGTIFHLGSHKGAGFEAVKKQVASAIEKVLAKTPDGVHLYLENAAGQSGAIGADLRELRELYEMISSSELKAKMKVCFDTQHGFSAGYDFRTATAVAESVARIDNELSFSLIGVIHANDSMVPFDGHKDRHENIGKGLIGKEGFRAVLAHPSFRELPFLLEVPGLNKSGPQARDIETLQQLSQQ